MKASCVVCGREFDKLRCAKTCGKDCSEQWRREAYRRYRAARPEVYREAARKYRAAHPERVREAKRRCRAARREQSAGGVPS